MLHVIELRTVVETLGRGRVPDLDELVKEPAYLVAVSDAQGLSFYADPTVGKLLKVSPEELSQARARLIAADLILYRYPIYQVLRLPPKRPPLVRLLCTKSPPRGGEASIGEILGKALKELHD